MNQKDHKKAEELLKLADDAIEQRVLEQDLEKVILKWKLKEKASKKKL